MLQLPLPFPREAGFDEVDFVPDASNQNALAWLGRGDWPEGRLALWGAAGCGKTHLLRAWARRAGSLLIQGRGFFDLAMLPEAGTVVLDDADTVMNDRTLLHLLNTARDRGLRVLLSGRSAPAWWPVHLPDLSSRLRAMTAAEIQAPSEDLLRILLIRTASERQIEIPANVQEWLLRRGIRSADAMLAAVARLDEASLGSGRSITRPFAADVLGETVDALQDPPFNA